jgi:hypothetical protein
MIICSPPSGLELRLRVRIVRNELIRLRLLQQPSVSPDSPVAPSVFTWVSPETISVLLEPELVSLV